MGKEIRALVDAVAMRVGRGDHTMLDQATRITLRALGSHLGGVPPALCDAIPAGLKSELEAGESQPRMGPAGLYLMLSNELGVRVGMALEIAQSVVAELAAGLTEPAREQLRQGLPPAWAVFAREPRPRGRGIGGPATTGHGAGHSLATGRPGGGRPLADAQPVPGHAESIARSDDPHDDRLATARGPGQRDAGRTLARGRPASLRPLSTAK